jgi:2-polyprenyl-3-methyl-5-hydroxy-6-metoxy-1,4-benzoquinol methylase
MAPIFRILALIFILAIAHPIAQSDPYAFYDDFRSWVRPYAAEAGKNLPAVLERYRTRLKEQGVEPAEIDRRVRLIETDRETLEIEFWNRFFTKPDNRGFNPEPNQFLVNITRGRRPGRALDVGMGQGRNALYLAQQGWEVTGIDIAERAMAVARQAAERNGLTLRTFVAKLEAFDYGQSQWDLVLFSWMGAMPQPLADRVQASLKPGGVVVVEGMQSWFGDNGLLRVFAPFRVLHYEDVVAPSDFFNRTEMRVARLCAERP